MNQQQHEADQLLIRIANALAVEDPENQPAADRACQNLYNFLKDSAVAPEWSREEAASNYYMNYVRRLGAR